MTSATGKRKFLMDMSSFDPTQDRGSNFWVPNGPAGLDLFRHASYSLWGLLKRGSNINLTDVHHLRGYGSAPYKILFGKPSVDNSSIFPLASQTITLHADRSKFNGSGWANWWEKYIKGGTYNGEKNAQIQKGTELPGIIAEDVTYMDHTFEIQTPYSEKELGAWASIGRPVQVKIDPVYNFYNEKYELASDQPRIPETVLPNLYVFTSYADNNHRGDVNPVYERLITLGQHLPKKTLKLRGSEIRNQYYNVWASKVLTTPALTIATLDQKGKNSSIPLAEVKKFNHYSELRREFPMYVNLSFSTDTETEFADALEASKLDVAFMADVMKETIPDIPNEMVEFPMVELDENPYFAKTEEGGTIIRKDPKIRGVSRKALDITGWMSKFIDFNEATMEMELAESTDSAYSKLRDRVDTFATFLGTTLDNDSILTDPKYEPFKRLMIMVLSGKLRKLVKDKFRTFEEVLNGKLAYSETVLYRIAKVGPDGNLIQNIYIPNSSNIDIFKFIDTQVKYNKDYTYTIFAYQMVIGTQYEYLDTFAGWRDQEIMEVRKDQRNTTAKFTVIYQPSIKLFEIPYHSTKRIVLDSPPLIPDVNIIPYRGKEDKIQIRLNGTLGRYEANPIIIESGDALHINRLQQHTLRLEEDDPIPFFRGRGDDLDFIDEFQVFRSTTKPESYRDMRGKLHKVLDTDVAARTPQEANSAEMNDTIKPNQKYYYMFRAVDKHGHISNPTTIYEVELVKQNGSVYPAISTIEGFAQSPKTSTKGMRRYLHIKPNIENSLINRDHLDFDNRELSGVGKDIERVKLGLEDIGDTVWGKKLKIRLTSKNSGKKIDFNLDFVTKHIKPGDS